MGIVKFENVSADRNHVGWFQISASLGNQASRSPQRLAAAAAPGAERGLP